MRSKCSRLTRISVNQARLRRERPEDPPPAERENLLFQFDSQSRLFRGGKCAKRVDGLCTEVTIEAGQCIEWIELLPSGLRREWRECAPGG